MQTFLPCKDYYQSAKCLDRQRLGKQRVEAYQILLALQNSNYGWQNHPAVKMWRGYEISLIEYGMAICHEWISRGYKDTLLDKFLAELPDDYCYEVSKPDWITDEFCSSHRSNLLRKNPSWYNQFGWTEPNNLDYVWPV